MQAAILCYRCLLTVDPADRDGWYNLGNALFDGGFAEAAAEAYRRALLLDPHHDASWHNLGVARHALGQGERALDALRRAVAYRPDNQASYHHIALIRFRAGDLDGSLMVLGWQACLAPQALDSSLVRMLAMALRDAGRIEAAIPLMMLAVAHRPDDVDLRHCLGMLHSALQDIATAEAIFRDRFAIWSGRSLRAEFLRRAAERHRRTRWPGRSCSAARSCFSRTTRRSTATCC